MNYKTLVVAPQTNLPMVSNEVQEVVNTLGAKMLREQATIHGLLEILKENFDIIWFSTHGDEKGVYLNDGILSTSEITALVRSAGAKLVVLNTCSSREIASTIYDELRIPFIATIRQLPDRTAYIFGTLLARKIALGIPFSQAFKSARPGQDKNYVFFPEQEITFEMPSNPYGESNDLTNLTRSVQRLEILVSGSRDYNVKGLIPTVENLDKRLEGVSDTVEELRSEQQAIRVSQDIIRLDQKMNRRMLIFIIVVLIAVVFTLGISVISRGGL